MKLLKKGKSILELSADEAKKYFLKNESFCNFDTPIYFKFDELLSPIDSAFMIAKADGKDIKDFCSSDPRQFKKVNYTILHNKGKKNGEYESRPFEIINPVLYVSLVHKITSEENWKFIKEHFNRCTEGKIIDCISIPRESSEKIDDMDKAEQILNWWKGIEQRSIETTLYYSYLKHTDLKRCYDSINIDSIAWALHGKEKCTDDNLIGMQINNHLRDMQEGREKGIPQGSTLMDFIAEILLADIDFKLEEKLKKENMSECKILRYRDDYRIFSNCENDNDKIKCFLVEIINDSGLKLSKEKTKDSPNLIQGSIKEDKLAWIKQQHPERRLRREDWKRSVLQRHLLVIHNFSIEFPNSGSLKKVLTFFYNDLFKSDFFHKFSNLHYKNKKLKKGLYPLVGILADMAYINSMIYPQTMAIISLLLSIEYQEKIKIGVLEAIARKICRIPYTGHFELWAQRLAFGFKIIVNVNEPLCKLVNKEVASKLKYNNREVTTEDILIWNFDWLENEFKEKFDFLSFIDMDEIKKLPEIIEENEVALFKDEDDYY